MCAEELLDGVGVRPCRVRGNHCTEELHEPLRGAHGERVNRMPDNVDVDMLSKVEANRKAARPGTLRVVVGNAWYSRKVREPDGQWRGIPLQMRRPRQRSRLSRGRKRALQQNALRMRGSEPRMNTAINLVERLDDLPAQRQELFVRRQGHGSVLRPMALLSTT